jgi:hypothetical protein
VATPVATVVEELHELLITLEEELTRREEAHATWEEKVGILEKALAKVSVDLDVERTKAEATQKRVPLQDGSSPHSRQTLPLSR